MTSKSAPPPSVPPQGVPSGNGKYAVVVIGLLAVVGAAVAYKKCQPEDKPTITQPSATVSVPPPRNTRDDDIPPPPPPPPDAGPDSGAKPATTFTGGGNPCDVKVCTGSATDDLSAALAQRAQASKRKCYYPALSGDPTLKGRASITVKVSSTGQVCSASVSSNELANSMVAECTANYYRTAGLPAPKGGCVTVTVPINFVPGQ
jgi:hypothetical protein